MSTTYCLAKYLSPGAEIPEGEVDWIEPLPDGGVRVHVVKIGNRQDYFECDADHRVTVYL